MQNLDPNKIQEEAIKKAEGRYQEQKEEKI